MKPSLADVDTSFQSALTALDKTNNSTKVFHYYCKERYVDTGPYGHRPARCDPDSDKCNSLRRARLVRYRRVRTVLFVRAGSHI